ncbi:MAG: hypothetical protein ACRC2T_12810 [Thermoguttaceae bacterium]
MSIILAFIFAFSIGCSGKVKVSGTVKYRDDSTPVQSGVVVFSSKGQSARGNIKDGKYVLGMQKDGDGIPKGTYTVTVESIRQSLGNGLPQESFILTESPSLDIQKSMSYDIVVDRLEALPVPTQ